MNTSARFRSAALGLVCTAVVLLPASGRDAPGQGASAADALHRLQVGNARYVCGKADHPNADARRRQETFADGQHPFAVVLTCSDSRVPVELIFDQGIGDLFVIRVAGNTCERQQAGSIEYAVEHLHTPLVVVMGHRGCGAVAVTVSGGDAHGNVESIIESIRPAAEKTAKLHPELKGDPLVAEAVKMNVWKSIEDLFHSSAAIAAAARTGKLKVVGAVYDIESAAVNWLGAHPEESRLFAGEAKVAGEVVTAGNATESNALKKPTIEDVKVSTPTGAPAENPPANPASSRDGAKSKKPSEHRP